MDIVTIHSTQSKYFVASRKFELPELKLLIDAVESSKFITKKKSETLIEKIHTMTSPGQVAKLKRNNYVVNRIKPDNEQIYYIIDAINDAINAGISHIRMGIGDFCLHPGRKRCSPKKFVRHPQGW